MPSQFAHGACLLTTSVSCPCIHQLLATLCPLRFPWKQVSEGWGKSRQRGGILASNGAFARRWREAGMHAIAQRGWAGACKWMVREIGERMQTADDTPHHPLALFQVLAAPLHCPAMSWCCHCRRVSQHLSVFEKFHYLHIISRGLSNSCYISIVLGSFKSLQSSFEGVEHLHRLQQFVNASSSPGTLFQMHLDIYNIHYNI